MAYEYSCARCPLQGTAILVTESDVTKHVLMSYGVNCYIQQNSGMKRFMHNLYTPTEF